MMKAAHLNEWCAVGTVPDTLSFGQVPAPPAPKKSQVLIKVKASAINVDDIAICQDTGGGGWYFHGRRPASGKPYIAGCEYAGVVLAAGPDCKKLKIGDRVCGVQVHCFRHSHGRNRYHPPIHHKESRLTHMPSLGRAHPSRTQSSRSYMAHGPSRCWRQRTTWCPCLRTTTTLSSTLPRLEWPPTCPATCSRWPRRRAHFLRVAVAASSSVTRNRKNKNPSLPPVSRM